MSEPSRVVTKERLRELLHEAGCRVTAQRVLLLQLLHDCESHVGADDLYHMARTHDPHLSLSTIYRTLNSLKQVGLVHELHLDEEHHHYELAGKGDHYHLVCCDCGKVTEVDRALVDDMLARLQAQYKFQIIDTSLEFAGYCADCQGR